MKTSSELGGRIRSIRKERGLSLKAVAEIVGVTKGFMSQIENGVSSPSLQTLRRIADALRSPPFAFFTNDEPGAVVVRRRAERTIMESPSHVMYQLLSPDLHRSLEMVLVQLEPGATAAEQQMGHPGEECNTVLSGRVRIEVSADHYDLEEGDTIYLDSNLPHRIVNIGHTTMLMISAIVPPTF